MTTVLNTYFPGRLTTDAGARPVNAVWGSAGNDVWACGADGLMTHYDGQAVISVSSGTIKTLNVVFGRAADDVWAVGADGAIVRFQTTSVGWSSVTV